MYNPPSARDRDLDSHAAPGAVFLRAGEVASILLKKPLMATIREMPAAFRGSEEKPLGIVEILRDYHRVFLLRNLTHGALEAELDDEWKQLNFTIQSLFSGMYQEGFDAASAAGALRALGEIPVDSLRVQCEATAMCEAEQVYFAGTVKDVSTGGTYVHALFPFRAGERVHVSLHLFPDKTTEVDCRVAWANTGGRVKRSLDEGAGLEFIHTSEQGWRQIRDYVQSIVEHTLTQAFLI